MFHSSFCSHGKFYTHLGELGGFTNFPVEKLGFVLICWAFRGPLNTIPNIPFNWIKAHN